MMNWSPTIDTLHAAAAAPDARRYVGWAETRLPVDRVWPLVGSLARWSEWLPDVSWTSALAPADARDDGRAFHIVWRGRLLEGRFRELHPMSYAEFELCDPRLGFAFDCCVALSRLPLGQSVAIVEMSFASWLVDGLAGANPCETLVEALHAAAAERR
ncbi:MAG: hypothetical protein HY908_11325 [Myxococcales bacterium]|nr:hypothetical protein [Myxococcales bacterium]